jgi:transposase-like protein
LYLKHNLGIKDQSLSLPPNMRVICPNCNHSRSWSIRRGKRKCKRCRHEFSIKRYPVKGIRSDIQEWQSCIGVFLRQRTGRQISRELGIGANRSVKMAQMLRLCMTKDTPPIFKGPVEFDETYIGGQRKNKRLHIRRIKAKHGHGTDKLAIMGIFDRNTKQMYVEIMPIKLNMEHILAVMKDRVPTGATVYTDGYKMYRGLKAKGLKHEYVDHDDGEYVREVVHTNNIEGFWGILKRKLSCIGGMRRDRMHLFVSEITWKFNHRHDSMQVQEQKLLEFLLRFGGIIQ